MSNRRDFQFGASCCFFGRFDEAVCADYQNAGVELMELSLDYNGYMKIGLFHQAQSIAQTAAQYGIKIHSLHIPFGPRFDITTVDDAQRAQILLVMYKFILAAAEASIPIAVIHPSTEPLTDEERAQRLAISHDSLKKLADFAASVNVKLAVENLPRTCLGNCPDDINYLLTDTKNLYVVFDTNHSLKGSNEDFLRAVAAAHPGKIITLHVSDYDFIDEKHWLPGNGLINWDALLTVLEEINYPGPFMHEVSSGKCGSLLQMKENAKKLVGC